MASNRECCRILTGKTHQLQTIGPYVLGQCQRALANIVALFRGGGLAKTHIVRNGCAIGICADMDEALLHAKMQQCFHAIGLNPEFSSLFKQRGPQGRTLVRGNIDFVGQLSAEADAVNSGFASKELCLTKSQMWESFVGEITFRLQTLKYSTRALARESNRRPLICYWHNDYAGIRPFTLPPLLQPGSNTAGPAARRGKQHAIVTQFDNRAIVENNPCLAQHDAVARASVFERCQVIDVKAISEFESVRADQLDFAQWRGVVDPYPIANELYLARYRPLSRLTAARKGGRALPLAEILEQGTSARLRPVQWCPPCW